MSEVKCIATRDSYGNALKELAAEGADKLVVLDADLSAATKTGIFKKEYPFFFPAFRIVLLLFIAFVSGKTICFIG